VEDDETRIRRIVAEETAAWNQGSARKFCVRLSEDSSLTDIVGRVYYGREAIEERMAEAFASVYKGSRIVMKVQKIRFVDGFVAIVDIDSEVVGYKTLPPGVRAPGDGTLRIRQQQVMVKGDGHMGSENWVIAAFHNVDVKSP
jgi:uncharacterized protein (TIGR02246 family)